MTGDEFNSAITRNLGWTVAHWPYAVRGEISLGFKDLFGKDGPRVRAISPTTASQWAKFRKASRSLGVIAPSRMRPGTWCVEAAD